jgi:hypothetical protein
MIPSWPGVVAAAAAGLLVFGATGWRAAARFFPDLPRWGVAPLLGFAGQLAVAAWLLPVLGFGAGAVMLAVLLPLGCGLALRGGKREGGAAGFGVPVLAGLLALVPLAGVMPKFRGGVPALSEPIFDHLKIAIVDAMLRSGVPPPNPFQSGPGAHGALAYYYGWHLAAAELARLAGLSGWGGDAALTGATACAALMLVGALATSLDRRSGLAAVLLAVPASLWSVLALVHRVLPLAPLGGLRGWLNQASWAPQHVMAACLVLVAALLLAALAEGPTILAAALLACCVAAGVGCSAWVGGVVAAAGLPASVLVLCWRLPPGQRGRFLAHAALGGAAGAILAAPVLVHELAGAVRHGRAMALLPFPVFRDGVNSVFDALAFPLLLALAFPLPVLFGIPPMLRLGRLDARWAALGTVAVAGVAASWFLRSTIGNDDLGWRAVLPALFVALPAAAMALRALWERAVWRVPIVTLIACAMAGSWHTFMDDCAGLVRPGAAAFVAEAAMWARVRAATGQRDRVLNDPASDAGLTLWPANLGWALLSGRPSCFAGWGAVQPFTSLPDTALAAEQARIESMFAGAPDPGVLAFVAGALQCDAVLLTPDSAAWMHDPFAAAGWTLAAAGPGFRLYRVKRA